MSRHMHTHNTIMNPTLELTQSVWKLPCMAPRASDSVPQLHQHHLQHTAASSLLLHDAQPGSPDGADTGGFPTQAGPDNEQERSQEYHQCTSTLAACGMCPHEHLGIGSGTNCFSKGYSSLKRN